MMKRRSRRSRRGRGEENKMNISVKKRRGEEKSGRGRREKSKGRRNLLIRQVRLIGDEDHGGGIEFAIAETLQNLY